MAQLNWTYVGNSGRRHHVGLFHGDRTGHLLVYCNSRVVLIDFHVLDTKHYPLFIDDELLEIKVEREGNQFSYRFDINKEADTPLNRERRKTEKKHLRQGLVLFAALIVFVLMVLIGLRWRQSEQLAETPDMLLSESGRETVAKVFIEERNHPDSRISYSFIADGKVYKGVAILPETSMPLESGDEFNLRYVRGNPEAHEIDFTSPTEKQLDRYRERAIELHADLHPHLSRRYVECLIDKGFEMRGPEAYAAFYRQEQLKDRGSEYDQMSFSSFMEDIITQLHREGNPCRK